MIDYFKLKQTACEDYIGVVDREVVSYLLHVSCMHAGALSAPKCTYMFCTLKLLLTGLVITMGVVRFIHGC